MTSGPWLRETFAFAYEAAGRKVSAPATRGWLGAVLGLLGRLFGGGLKPGARPRLPPPAFPAEDVEFLRGLSANLTKLNLTKPDRA